MKLYVAYRYQQRHCLAALPAKMSVFKSHMPATFQWLQMNPDYTEKRTQSYNENPESLCCQQKHMRVLIWIETVIGILI